MISDIWVDPGGLLWVASARRREGWEEGMVEMIRPDGVVSLAPADDRISSIFGSRIDVIDLNQAAIVASLESDALILAFVGDGLMFEPYYTAGFVPQAVVWRATLER
jgi:hypothetical protein